jgi:GNAT superfamily N-acetyltransferase
MNIHLRPAWPGEANALSQIALSAKRHWGYPARWIEIWTPQLTFSPDYFQENETWVAEEGHPIAFYTLQERDGNAWIENLWVLPDYMGQGIGKQLFLHAMSRSLQLGYKILQLEADPNAVVFYEKVGMHKIGERQSEIEGRPRSLPIMEVDL